MVYLTCMSHRFILLFYHCFSHCFLPCCMYVCSVLTQYSIHNILGSTVLIGVAYFFSDVVLASDSVRESESSPPFSGVGLGLLTRMPSTWIRILTRTRTLRTGTQALRTLTRTRRTVWPMMLTHTSGSETVCLRHISSVDVSQFVNYLVSLYYLCLFLRSDTLATVRGSVRLHQMALKTLVVPATSASVE